MRTDADALPTAPRDPRIRVGLGLLLALVFGVYSATYGHGFVVFDDPVYIYENDVVSRGLSGPGAAWAFGYHASNWHPLTWLSHMLDVELFGLDAGGHHLVAVVLHALNASLFFLALRAMSGSNWASLLAAALFALHPLRVESVAWASERKDVLSTTFWMTSLYAYARYVRNPKKSWLALVALALAIGLTAKQMLVTLPCVLLLLDIWPLRRSTHFGINAKAENEATGRAPIWREKLALFALVIAGSVTVFLAQRLSGAVVDLEPLSPLSRFGNAVRSYAIYLFQTLWPRNLACFYPHPAAPGMDPRTDLWIPAGAALLLLASLSTLAWRLRRRAPYLLIGWLWYLGTAVPVIGIIQVGQQAHADRYTYVPLLGLAMAAAFGLRDLVRHRPGLRNPVVAASTLLLLVYAGMTYRQASYWSDSRTLFAHAVEATERNFYARTFHGVSLRTAGELDAARSELKIARELHPGFSRIYWELGLVERDAKNFELAARELKTAVQMDRDDARKRNDLGTVLMELDRLDEAEKQFNAALRADPDNKDSLLNLGGMAFNQKELKRAEQLYRRVLWLQPGHVRARLELAALLLMTERTEEARPILEELRREAPETERLERLLRILDRR